MNNKVILSYLLNDTNSICDNKSYQTFQSFSTESFEEKIIETIDRISSLDSNFVLPTDEVSNTSLNIL